MPDRVTAMHEAGHAVAAVMRGGSSLTSVTLSETHGEGIAWCRIKPCDLSFVTHGGPWAEARQLWPLDTLDGEDAEGCTFDDYVAGVYLAQPGDAADSWAPDRSGAVSPEHVWSRELESVRHVIRHVAEMLLDGATVTDAVVRGMVDAAHTEDVLSVRRRA